MIPWHTVVAIVINLALFVWLLVLIFKPIDSGGGSYIQLPDFVRIFFTLLWIICTLAFNLTWGGIFWW